jgi:hypothetical protein
MSEPVFIKSEIVFFIKFQAKTSCYKASTRKQVFLSFKLLRGDTSSPTTSIVARVKMFGPVFIKRKFALFLKF